jgi:hypothetical protein
MNTSLFQQGQRVRTCLDRIAGKMAKMTYIPTKEEFFSWSEEASYHERGKRHIIHACNIRGAGSPVVQKRSSKRNIYILREYIYSLL